MTNDQKKNLYEELEKIFNLEINSINESTTHEEIDSWDSVNIIKMIVNLENLFRVNIDPEDAIEMLSVKSIIKIIEKKFKENN